MKKFIIERKMPGAGNLCHEELKGISQTSNAAVASLGKPYRWIESFVTEDAIFCIHEAEDASVIEAHAVAGNFPIHVIREIKNVFGPETAK